MIDQVDLHATVPVKKNGNMLQSGRTMLEMMGVLGIIGLLTVGGLMYWRSALVKMHQNDIMENIYKRAVTRVGSAHVRNIYEKETQTGYSFGIRTPVIACHNRKLISVGQIHGERALYPSLCIALIKQIHTEPKLKGVYSENCERVSVDDAEDFCADATFMYVEVQGR